MFIKKMYNKMDKVSDPVLGSYLWEAKREKVIPKNPKAYR